MSDEPKLALLPWGDLIEDFLDTIGLSLEDFAERMIGGWMFGYIEALRGRGIHTTVFCFSSRVPRTTRFVHGPTGADVIALPASRSHLWLRRQMKDPYGWTPEAMFGPAPGLPRVWRHVVRHTACYLATPVERLAHAVRRAGCSAMLCQEYESPRFDAAIAVGALLRMPVFATFQGGDWHRSRIEDVVRPFTLRRCAGCVVGPASEAARLREQYGVPPEKIARVFNPIDVTQWRAAVQADCRNQLGIAPATRVAVWHGRIDIRRKGLDILLDAWQAVCDARPGADVLLLLVGSGQESGDFADLLGRRRVPRIRWVREYVVDRDALRRYLSAADVFVFPSRHEGFPVAPLEAMACGLPAVAAAAPGVADIFEGGEDSGGVVVPTEAPGAFAVQLGRLLDDDGLRRRLGARARARVEEAFSLSAIGAQLAAFFRERSGFGVGDRPD